MSTTRISPALYVAQGLLVALVLARIYERREFASVLGLLAVVVVLVGVRAGLLTVREAAARRASGIVKEAVRQRLIGKVLELGPGWLQRARSGEVQSTLVDGTERLDPYVGLFLPQSVAAVLGAIAVTAYIATSDPLVGTVFCRTVRA